MKEISRIKAKGQIGYAHIWLFLAFTIGFFAPLNIYLANISDFWYSPNLLLPLITGTFAIMALGLFLVTIILSKVLSDSIYHIYLLSVLLISTGLFIQGNFIPDSIGSLDGTDVTWNMMSVDAICSFVLWGIIVLVFVISIRNKIAEKIVKKSMPLVLMFFAIEIITIVTLVVMKGNFKDKNYYEVSTIGEFDYSADENFFLFILDNFDSSQLSNRLGEREKDIFKDFTYYPDTASVYGHTDLSVPQIITGINYYNDKSYGEYLKDAYDNGELLNYLRDEKWNMGLYTECKVPAGNVADAAVNCEKLDVGISSKRRFLTYTYQLVAYKYVPYCVKRFFWFYPDIINETKDILDDNIEPYVWLESIFYKNMNLNVSKDQNNTFRLYHLKGLHGPRYTDSNLNEVDERVSWDEAYEGNMLLLSSFLSELKKKNIYDNSVIVILADHGESYDSDGGEIKDNPLFMLKGKNENHEFAISDIAVSYAELQKIYLGLIKGEKSYEAVEELYKENKRIFLRYDYDVEKKEDDYFPAIRECLINGNAADVDAVEYTGKVYTNR